VIELSYNLSSSWNAKAQDVDWAGADETTLRYRVFLGDQVFVVNGADFSAKWGWIPLLDFAAGLVAVTRGLAAGETELAFDFTESDAHLQFNRQGSNTLITSSYNNATATIPTNELERAATSFAERVLRDAMSRYPALKANRSLPGWYPTLARINAE
jgi:hypothetical protein